MATANKNLSDYDKATIPNARNFGLGLLFQNGMILLQKVCFKVLMML